MIVADTNILSTFARIQRIDLLFAVAETDSLHLAPAVVKELKVGVQKGLVFLKSILKREIPYTSAKYFYRIPWGE
jgi:predicted nucleic acid-binding protein